MCVFKTAMSHSQTWSLSEAAGKRSGTCKVCLAVRQLHNKDGTVHKHGPRDNPCPGSHQLPLSGSEHSQITQAAACSSAALSSSLLSCRTTTESSTNQVNSFNEPHTAIQSSQSPGEFPFWALSLCPIIKHIPKAARFVCATHLAGLLRKVADNPYNLKEWKNVLTWSRRILGSLKRGGKRHKTASIVKQRVVDFDNGDVEIQTLGFNVRRNSSRSTFRLADAVAAKLEDGNVRAAVRLLMSDDTPADTSEDILAKLTEKHPLAPTDRCFDSQLSSATSVFVDESAVSRAVRSFPAGSSGGPDGFKPQHLLDLVSNREGGTDLLSALTAFINMLLQGHCHPDIVPIFFGGRLIALNKASGDIRPIAVGYTLRRLTSKCACAAVSSKLSVYLAPQQLGFGIPGGCEAAVHATRRFLQSMPDNHVVAKLDFRNAFNSLHRDRMLQAVSRVIPELYRYCHLAYSQSTLLSFGPYTVLSQEGPQQGDPIGPLLFCITVHPLLQSLSSQLKVGYLDDFCLGGTEQSVARDVEMVMILGQDMGLSLNVSKCELIQKPCTTCSNPFLGGFKKVDLQNMLLLGSPIMPGPELDRKLQECCSDLARAVRRLELIDAHDALVLLRSSFGTPKMQYILRCCPCYGHQALTSFDELLKTGLSRITNCDLSEMQWLQASLPVKEGGLGVSKVSELALSAYLASAAGTLHIQDQMLLQCNVSEDQHLADYKSMWATLFPTATPPEPPLSFRQSSWNRPAVIQARSRITESATDIYSKARLLAVTAPHSADWLHARPISSCGLRLDNEAIRVAVSLRLGVPLCQPHMCLCGSMVDANGYHSLSCKKTSGRVIRHQTLNDIIWRSLSKAGIPAVKEPAGLSRTDGKRPDGMTLIPWFSGKSVVWDVSVVNTMAASYIATSSQTAAGVAEIADRRKTDKYSFLSSSYLFQPIAIETFGCFNQSGLDFIFELGRRLISISDDARERDFLFQRLSVTIQRFNAVCFSSCFVSGRDSDHI